MSEKLFMPSFVFEKSCRVALLFIVFLGHLTAANAFAANMPPNKLLIIALLQSGQYEALEKRFTGWQRDFERGKIDAWEMQRVYNTFAYSDPDLRARLDDWVKRKPASYTARTARGVYLFHLGWLWRGNLSAANTHPTRFDMLRAHMTDARVDFEAALELNDKVMQAYSSLIGIELVIGSEPSWVSFLPNNRWSALFKGIVRKMPVWLIHQAGRSAVPSASILHFDLLLALDPRWGGSSALTDLLFRYAKWRSDDDPTYARLFAYRKLHKASEAHSYGSNLAALKLVNQALEKRDWKSGRYLRAKIYRALGRDKDALAAFKSVRDDQNASWHLDIGALLMRMQHREQALKHFDRAVALDPYNVENLHFRANLKIKLRRLDRLKTDLDRMLVFGRYDADVHSIRSHYFLYRKRDYARAASAAKSATELAPRVTSHWNLYSAALIKQKDCSFIDAARTRMQLCALSQRCNRSESAGMVKQYAETARKLRCQRTMTLADIRDYFGPTKEIAVIPVEGIRLGTTLADLRRRFPEMKYQAENFNRDQR